LIARSRCGRSVLRLPISTLEAHEKGGVNYVDFYPGTDKPYLATSGDDRTIKIWDNLSKAV